MNHATRLRIFDLALAIVVAVWLSGAATLIDLLGWPAVFGMAWALILVGAVAGLRIVRREELRHGVAERIILRGSFRLHPVERRRRNVTQFPGGGAA